MTDEGPFAVSESTVYRILKRRGLIRPRPLEERPAGKEWSHKTSRVDEIWQTDATHFLVKGWGRYKAIPVLDDYSRKLMAMPMKPDETGGSISDALEEALENAEKEGHNGTGMPVLLSDNGPGFAGGELAGYLRARSMRHIFGAPYHPQTQGKVERLNRKLKSWVSKVTIETPFDPERSFKSFIKGYNATPHESLKNVSPNDVYAGRKEDVLSRRARMKWKTMWRRRRINLAGAA